MSIAWLWYYTSSVNPVPLETSNEQRAFTIYARWRAVIRRASCLIEVYRVAQRKRIERRALLALSDHLLEDIGMFRTGRDVRIEEVRTPESQTIAAPVTSKVSCNHCVVMHDMHVTPDTSDMLTTNKSSRAA